MTQKTFADLIDEGLFPDDQTTPMAFYESLEAPQSVEDCDRLIADIRDQLQDLETSRILFGGNDEERFEEWQKKTRGALFVKKKHLVSLRVWKAMQDGSDSVGLRQRVGELHDEVNQLRKELSQQRSHQSLEAIALVELAIDTFSQVLTGSPYAERAVDRLLSEVTRSRTSRKKEISEDFRENLCKLKNFMKENE
jgi:hypothetical protein